MEVNMNTFTVRLDPDTVSQLDGLASSLGRSRSWVVKEAVAQYLEQERQYRQEVQKGLDALAAGDVLPHQEVVERLKARGVHVD
jgi:predicted transcriptional regulator